MDGTNPLRKTVSSWLNTGRPLISYAKRFAKCVVQACAWYKHYDCALQIDPKQKLYASLTPTSFPGFSVRVGERTWDRGWSYAKRLESHQPRSHGSLLPIIMMATLILMALTYVCNYKLGYSGDGKERESGNEAGVTSQRCHFILFSFKSFESFIVTLLPKPFGQDCSMQQLNNFCLLKWGTVLS